VTWFARKENNKTRELTDRLASNGEVSSIGRLSAIDPKTFEDFLPATASNTPQNNNQKHKF
jgi:hypothetical protein